MNHDIMEVPVKHSAYHAGNQTCMCVCFCLLRLVLTIAANGSLLTSLCLNFPLWSLAMFQLNSSESATHSNQVK